MRGLPDHRRPRLSVMGLRQVVHRVCVPGNRGTRLSGIWTPMVRFDFTPSRWFRTPARRRLRRLGRGRRTRDFVFVPVPAGGPTFLSLGRDRASTGAAFPETAERGYPGSGRRWFASASPQPDGSGPRLGAVCDGLAGDAEREVLRLSRYRRTGRLGERRWACATGGRRALATSFRRQGHRHQ